jgi:hypothetical protein
MWSREKVGRDIRYLSIYLTNLSIYRIIEYLPQLHSLFLIRKEGRWERRHLAAGHSAAAVHS